MRTHMLCPWRRADDDCVKNTALATCLGKPASGLTLAHRGADCQRIGFLGAGMIFIKKQSVSGLTTAAGIWATAGIGMAIGARMFFWRRGDAAYSVCAVSYIGISDG